MVGKDEEEDEGEEKKNQEWKRKEEKKISHQIRTGTRNANLTKKSRKRGLLSLSFFHFSFFSFPSSFHPGLLSPIWIQSYTEKSFSFRITAGKVNEEENSFSSPLEFFPFFE